MAHSWNGYSGKRVWLRCIPYFPPIEDRKSRLRDPPINIGRRSSADVSMGLLSNSSDNRSVTLGGGSGGYIRPYRRAATALRAARFVISRGAHIRHMSRRIDGRRLARNGRSQHRRRRTCGGGGGARSLPLYKTQSLTCRAERGGAIWRQYISPKTIALLIAGKWKQDPTAPR